MKRSAALLLLSTLLCAAVAAAPAPPPRPYRACEVTAWDKQKVVRVTARSGSMDADGRQVISITLDINSRFSVFANPTGNEDLESYETSLNISSRSRPVSARISYPAGELVKDKVVGNYRIYSGKVNIKAAIERAGEGRSPLDLAVTFRACNAALSFRSTVHLTLP